MKPLYETSTPTKFQILDSIPNEACKPCPPASHRRHLSILSLFPKFLLGRTSHQNSTFGIVPKNNDEVITHVACIRKFYYILCTRIYVRWNELNADVFPVPLNQSSVASVFSIATSTAVVKRTNLHSSFFGNSRKSIKVFVSHAPFQCPAPNIPYISLHSFLYTQTGHQVIE